MGGYPWGLPKRISCRWRVKEVKVGSPNCPQTVVKMYREKLEASRTLTNESYPAGKRIEY